MPFARLQKQEKKKKRKDYDSDNKIRQSAIHQQRGLSFVSFFPDMMPASTGERWHQPFHIVSMISFLQQSHQTPPFSPGVIAHLVKYWSDLTSPAGSRSSA